MPYLLDADWIINALAGRAREIAILSQLAPGGVAITWITIGEVYEGAFSSPTPDRHLYAFRRFLRPFRIIDLDDLVMERFAETRLSLRRKGELIPDFDVLLGAVALRHDLTVLTLNVRHLKRIPGVKVHSGVR